MKAFLARDCNGKLFLYIPHSPIKLKREWMTKYTSDVISHIHKDLFPEVKWEDEEPTEINIEIVNKNQ